MSFDFLNFTKNGLQFLNRIFSQQPNVDLDDELGTPVDEEEGDICIDRESDVDLEENRDDIDLDLVEGSNTDPEPQAGADGEFPWSGELHDIAVELFSSRTGPKIRPSTLPQICGKPHFWPLRKIPQV